MECVENEFTINLICMKIYTVLIHIKDTHSLFYSWPFDNTNIVY